MAVINNKYLDILISLKQPFHFIFLIKKMNKKRLMISARIRF